MDLYLIRHGETVDNVAGLYAGIRDSALTNHGVEQARRLGESFAKNNVLPTHIFSSPLSRALKTAQSIQRAQVAHVEGIDGTKAGDVVAITQVAELIEQNFGFYEGKPFHSRSEANRTGRSSSRAQQKSQASFVDVEDKESMGKRADDFLSQHLLPLFGAQPTSGKYVVIVVSHGMLLAHLWRRLLKRLPRKSISSQDVLPNSLEHLGGWSNTGYLHLTLSRRMEASHVGEMAQGTSSKSSTERGIESRVNERILATAQPFSEQFTLEGWMTEIVSIDNKMHLIGLKRQRGGIGRSAHDEGQKKLDGFFKRRRTEGGSLLASSGTSSASNTNNSG